MKDVTSLGITTEQWRAAMEDLSKDSPGKTTAEIAFDFGIDIRAVQRRIAKLIDEGKCVQGMAKRITRRGYYQRVPVYQLINTKDQL